MEESLPERDSLDKWKHIEKEILKKTENPKPIWAFYWNPCSYCEIYEDCDLCPLKEKKVNDISICSDSLICYAFITLLYATDKKFDDALRCCRIVIEAIEENIRSKEEKKGDKEDDTK